MKQSEEVEIEDLKSDDKAEQSLPTCTKKRQELSRKKKSLVLKELFKKKSLISEKLCQIWKKIDFTKFEKSCFSMIY